jgi:hypothetical protein
MKKEKQTYIVVHPLDDIREEKVDVKNLGPMNMTLSTKILLYVLRGYLVIMICMLFYRVLAGWLF